MQRTTYAPEAPEPGILTVGCVGALLRRCREAAAEVPIALEAAELTALAVTAARLRPLVLLVSSDVYGFDPEEFDALARAVGAQRMLVEVDEPLPQLASRLRESVNEAETTRLFRARAQAPTEPPKRSGVRWTTPATRTKDA